MLPASPHVPPSRLRSRCNRLGRFGTRVARRVIDPCDAPHRTPVDFVVPTGRWKEDALRYPAHGSPRAHFSCFVVSSVIAAVKYGPPCGHRRHGCCRPNCRRSDWQHEHRLVTGPVVSSERKHEQAPQHGSRMARVKSPPYIGSKACNALIDGNLVKICVMPVYKPDAVATIHSNRPKGKKRFKGATGRCPAFATT